MLVVTVNALSTGLDNAQATVFKPLTGLGTDMTVTRPLTLSTGGGNPFANLSPAERKQLRSEAGPHRSASGIWASRGRTSRAIDSGRRDS